MSSLIHRNLTEIEAVAGSTFACIRNTTFQINCQPFYLCQLLKFHPFDWLIEIYLQTEEQGSYHKMVSLQAMPGFPSLFLSYILFSGTLLSKETEVCFLYMQMRYPKTRNETHGKWINLQYKITTSIEKEFHINPSCTKGGGCDEPPNAF